MDIGQTAATEYLRVFLRAGIRQQCLRAFLPPALAVPRLVDRQEQAKFIFAMFLMVRRFQPEAGVVVVKNMLRARKRTKLPSLSEAIASFRTWSFARAEHVYYVWTILLAELRGAVPPGSLLFTCAVLPRITEAVGRQNFKWFRSARGSLRKAFWRELGRHRGAFERALAKRPDARVLPAVQQENDAIAHGIERGIARSHRLLRAASPRRVLKVVRRARPRARRVVRRAPVAGAGPPVASDEPPSSDDDPSSLHARGPPRPRQCATTTVGDARSPLRVLFDAAPLHEARAPVGLCFWLRGLGMSEFLGVAAIARQLGVNARTVVRWIDEGELRAIEGVGRGRGLRVAREWFEAFVEERKRHVPDGPAARRSPEVAKCDASEKPFSSVRDARHRLLGGRR